MGLEERARRAQEAAACCGRLRADAAHERNRALPEVVDELRHLLVKYREPKETLYLEVGFTSGWFGPVRPRLREHARGWAFYIFDGVRESEPELLVLTDGGLTYYSTRLHRSDLDSPVVVDGGRVFVRPGADTVSARDVETELASARYGCEYSPFDAIAELVVSGQAPLGQVSVRRNR